MQAVAWFGPVAPRGPDGVSFGHMENPWEGLGCIPAWHPLRPGISPLEVDGSRPESQVHV